ncbi:amino acid transporter [Streptomyces sp. NPDC002838]|uniref:nucleotidyltransferase domain-containing protein n=1 Tax=Streptomyces sp. NPDC002838 TaxID=3154436 RepID=UPI00332C6BED
MREEPFDDPPFGQHHEATHVVAALDDRQDQGEGGQAVLDGAAGVTAVGSDQGQAVMGVGEAAVMAALSGMGFAESLDWRPIRFVVTDLDGREIDLHPLVFAEDGSAAQASFEPERPFMYPSSCFVTGVISGTTVPCLSAEQQVYFHQGYEPTDRDCHDMAQLRRVFGISTHF